MAITPHSDFDGISGDSKQVVYATFCKMPQPLLYIKSFQLVNYLDQLLLTMFVVMDGNCNYVKAKLRPYFSVKENSVWPCETRKH